MRELAGSRTVVPAQQPLHDVAQGVCPAPGDVGAELARRVGDIEGVLGVGVAAFGRAFRVRTVIGEYDMDLCDRVFAAEAELYQCFPDLEADFLVLSREDPEGERVLGHVDQDFLWIRASS